MADTKISGLPDDSAPSLDDELVTVNDPAGTPASRKADIDSVLALSDARTKTLTNTTIDADGTGNSLTNVDAAKIQGVAVDATELGSPSDGDILVYRSAGTDFVLEAKPAAGSNPAAADITDATADGIALVTSADANPFTDADETKLDGIEASADVTDSTNVTAAGALMDSEVTNLADVKAFDTSDYATAAQGTLADSAVQPADIASGTITARADDIDFSGGSDGDVLTVQADGSLAPETPAGGGGGMSDLVDDTTPQLGGDLDVNGNAITGYLPSIDEDDMTSNSATSVPTQQSVKAYVDTEVAGAGGGGASTPRRGVSTWFEDADSVRFSTTLSASCTQTIVSTGLDFRLGSGSTDACVIYQGNNNDNLNIFDKNPSLFANAEILSGNSGNTWEAIIAFGGRILNGTTLNKAKKHIGFIMKNNNGTLELYASNGNGTTQTETDVTGSINLTHETAFYIEMDSGTDIKFYVDGTLVATHTTNLPSGIVDYRKMVIGAKRSSGTGSSEQFRMYEYGYEYDAY